MRYHDIDGDDITVASKDDWALVLRDAVARYVSRRETGDSSCDVWV
jgi:hypothetical protein